MSIKPDEVKEGDILVGHGLLITPSLLIDNKVKLDEGRLLDFCTLMNALTIHDRLITLPASIPDSLRNSQLYQYLRKKNILQELSIQYDEFSQEEILEIEDLFGSRITEQDVNMVLNSIYSEYNQKTGYSRYAESANSLNERNIFLRRSRFIDEVIKRRPNEWNPNDFVSLTQDIFEGTIPLSQIQQQRELERDQLQLHFLRTAGYWEIAGKYKLAFLPDFMRIPIISLYNARLTQSLRMFIASKVDDQVKKELAAALQIASPTPIPIPNSVSIFLNRYSRDNLEDTLDNMRGEFSKHRSAIVNWEKKLQRENMDSYNDVKKVMREIDESLKALRPTDWTEIAVSATSNVANDIVSSFVTSSVSTGGFASHIEKGINLIRRCFQRKRISFFNSGKREAANIKGMNNLLAKALGGSLTKRRIDRFLGLTNSIDRLVKLNQDNLGV